MVLIVLWLWSLGRAEWLPGPKTTVKVLARWPGLTPSVGRPTLTPVTTRKQVKYCRQKTSSDHLDNHIH